MQAVPGTEDNGLGGDQRGSAWHAPGRREESGRRPPGGDQSGLARLNALQLDAWAIANRNSKIDNAAMSTESIIAQRIASAAEFRHRLHQIPELSFEEVKTAAAIRAELDELKIPYTAGVKDAATATIALI